MKARLTMDAEHNLILLCSDGTIAKASEPLLYDLLTGFNRNESEKYFSGGSMGRWDIEHPDMALVPGETYAIIADNGSLVISDFSPFQILMNDKTYMRNYISVPEFAKKYNKSEEIIKVFCRNGRIPGAIKVSRNWLIPVDAEYPVSPEYQREGVRGPRPHTRKRTTSDS